MSGGTNKVKVLYLQIRNCEEGAVRKRHWARKDVYTIEKPELRLTVTNIVGIN